MLFKQIFKGIKKHIISNLLILGFTNSLFSQTVLNPGDIAVIAFKTNTSTESGNDAVKLVTLVDLECNTQFIVTDNNWNGSAWACNDDEAGLQITCNAAIAAGSVFYIDFSAAATAVSCSGGSISRTDLGSPWGTNFGFNSGGDNVYVLQGTRASPTFVYAFKHVGSYASSTCSDKDKANLPSNLTLGTSAIVMSSSANQWNYNCATNSGTKTTILSAISNTSNWISNTAHIWDATNCIFRVSTAFLPYGVLAVSGAGCGCLANCQLAYSGGVNCGAGVTGNCTAGYQTLTTSVTVPGGCTYNIVAEMKNRNYSCSSSGADGNCQTCDNIKVDLATGTKTFQQGAGNAALTDNYSLTGPGTIVITARADRADEIVTYSIQATPCSCLLSIILPVELVAFSAKQENKSAELNWTTFTERNSMYFTVERSADAEQWESLLYVNALGNSNYKHNYKIYDSSPIKGLSYYRLRETDMDGTAKISQIVSLDFKDNESRKIIKRLNVFGQEINENTGGLIFLVYDTGEVERIYN